MIDTNRHGTTLAGNNNVSIMCSENRLQQKGYLKKMDLLVPYKLKEIHLTQRINKCELLITRNQNALFLKDW